MGFASDFVGVPVGFLASGVGVGGLDEVGATWVEGRVAAGTDL